MTRQYILPLAHELAPVFPKAPAITEADIPY